MKQLLFILFVVSISLSSCSITNPTEACENKICTQEFRMVHVIFKDASGAHVQVSDFTAVNERTGERTGQDPDPSTVSNQGYVVASDSDVKSLSEKGDKIKVNARHALTGKSVTAEFVVSGGICACHINKISGPSEIIL
jgi:hypothetical protein